jgi:hypothetical protein
MTESLIQSDYDIVDYEAGMSDEVLGKECASCFRLLRWKFFDRDSSRKDGRDLQCSLCKKAPRLSIAEHTARLKEANLNSYGTRRQRHQDQAEMRKGGGGRSMDCSLFLQKLLHVYPALYVTEGGIVGDLALYATSGTIVPEWNGNSFKYMGYVSLGVMPEFSSYEFDESRDIMVRVKKIGWRDVLVRFVQNHILSEAQCDQEFGVASGGGNSIWFKKLHRYRNAKI